MSQFLSDAISIKLAEIDTEIELTKATVDDLSLQIKLAKKSQKLAVLREVRLEFEKMHAAELAKEKKESEIKPK